MRALLFVLLLTGCGDWTQMDCSNTIKTATIVWEHTDDPAATCEKLGAGRTLDRGGACISVNGSVSILYAEAPAKIDDQILGHEVKHAFGCKHS